MDNENGPGGGKKRGDLFASRFGFKLADNWDGYLSYDWMDLDDYYTAERDYAHYMIFEILYHF